jgi:AcrR family transcriptional regulator
LGRVQDANPPEQGDRIEAQMSGTRTSDRSARGASRQRVKGNGNSEPLRQAELLGIAADLFAERGYTATTVRDIADAAGILSGSLYHHFDSKESMVDAILSRFIEHTLESYDRVLAEGRTPLETFTRLVEVSLQSMTTERSAILVYQNEARFLLQEERFSYLQTAHRRFQRVWTDVLEEGVRAGEFRPEIDPRLVYRLVRDTVWAAPRWWRPGGNLKYERIIDQYVGVLVNGIVLHPADK